MAEVIMTVGNIGTGKSTLVRKLVQSGHAIVNMDAVQASISGGIYGAYDSAKKDVYRETEETMIVSALRAGVSVCIDRTNMDRKRRQRFINLSKEHTDTVKCIDFGPGEEKHLNRRLADARGVPRATWQSVFNSMRQAYEKPDISEGFTEIIKPPERYEFHAFDFDGCIVENKFPEIGDIINGAVEKINDLYQDLKNIIIVWSCRSGDFEATMVEFLRRNKIPFDFVNENPIANFTGRKIFAHQYYDDRNAPMEKLIG